MAMRWFCSSPETSPQLHWRVLLIPVSSKRRVVVGLIVAWVPILGVALDRTASVESFALYYHSKSVSLYIKQIGKNSLLKIEEIRS